MVDSILAGYELLKAGKAVGWLLGEFHGAPSENDKKTIDGLLPQADIIIMETRTESAQQEREYTTINDKNPFYMKRKKEIDAIVEKFRPFYNKVFNSIAETIITWHPLVLNNYIIGQIINRGCKDYLQKVNVCETPSMYCVQKASERETPIIGAYPPIKHYDHLWEPVYLEEAYEGLQGFFSEDVDKEKLKQRIMEKIKEPIVTKETKEKLHDEERNPLFAEIIYSTIEAEKKPLAIYGAGHSKDVLENLENKRILSKKIA